MSAVLFSVCLATSLFAADNNETATHHFNAHGFDVHVNNGNNGGGNDARGVSPDIPGQLSYYNGPLMANAKIVLIFWGTYWNAGAGATMASEITSFRNSSVGLQSHMSSIAQYNAGTTGFKGAQNDIFDSTEPPTAVSDAALQNEVKKWFSGMYDVNAIYEVFLPPTSYGVDTDTTTSCGGPNLGWCAYHGSFVDGIRVKYSMEPYPSCTGCSGPKPAWDDIRNAEHFMTHETREAMTDPAVGVQYGWRDLRGYEADDKCAWGGSTFKTLFIENASDGHQYGYQMEYSNAVRGCVK